MVIGYKTLGVEHQNARDRNIFQNESVEIANPCVLTRTHSDLSVFVSRLCPAKEPPLKKNSEKLANVLPLQDGF